MELYPRFAQIICEKLEVYGGLELTDVNWVP